jgi:mannose-6-phosphate isomerase-like protein (cupin superfamily)
MEVRRFGIGNRSRRGPAGTVGVTGGVIHADARGTISELAFGRRATLEPQLTPNTTWFVVIEGGGLVQVGEERAIVAAGEAVCFPAGIPHAVRTETTQLRAIVVELAGPDDGLLRGILAAGAIRRDASGEEPPVERAVGGLTSIPGRPAPDPEAGEPD